MKKILFILSLFFTIILSYTSNWAESDKVLAIFNGEKITISEFNLLCQRPIDHGRRPITKKEKEDFLDAIIASFLITPMAKKIGMNEDLIIKQKFKAFRKYLLNYFLKQKIIETIAIDDNNYKNYISSYGRKKVRFREIVVRNRPEAEEILRDILNGKDFETLAKEKSINKNSKNGGDTRFVIMGKGTFLEQVENIIFKLKDGEVSEILKTLEGYAIFKTVERKNLTDQERGEAIQRARWKLIKRKTESLLENLRSKANIKVFLDNVKKIQEINNFDDVPLQIELAKVNKTTIKLVDVLIKTKDPIFNSLKTYHLRTSSNINKMIDDKINETLMVNEAIRIGLDKNPKVQNLSKRFEEWYLAFEYVNDELIKDVTYTEEEIKKFYDRHKNSPRYKNLPALVHVRHILLDDENSAQKILKRLKNGADFAEMAQKYSILSSSSRVGGGLGYLRRGERMTKEEEEVLFRLSVGEISGIIKRNLMKHGNEFNPNNSYPSLYSIFKLEDKIIAGQNDYNEIYCLIKKELLEKKREEKIKEFIDQLMAKANIKKNSDFLNSTMENSPR